MYTLTGILRLKRDEQVISESFKKREFVVTDKSGGYPQHVTFQLTQGKCALLDAFNPGDEVRVSFNLRGREWTNKDGEVKFFNSLEAWKLERAGGEAPGGGEGDILPDEHPAGDAGAEDNNDLPF